MASKRRDALGRHTPFAGHDDAEWGSVDEDLDTTGSRMCPSDRLPHVAGIDPLASTQPKFVQ
jgi:hypothetical protein